MHHMWRDVLASVLVAAAVIAYAGWWIAGNPTADQLRLVALAVLALGVGASMSAVVPGFAELLRGSRMYMGVASVLGVVAFGAGLWALVAAEGTALTLLVLATVVLWAMSTARHLSHPAPHPVG